MHGQTYIKFTLNYTLTQRGTKIYHSKYEVFSQDRYC